MNGARDAYLRAHTAGLYDALTGRCTRPLRVEDLVYRAAAEVPGLAPTREDMEAERGRMLADKEGIEFAQGLLVSHVLALPRAGGTWWSRCCARFPRRSSTWTGCGPPARPTSARCGSPAAGGPACWRSRIRST